MHYLGLSSYGLVLHLRKIIHLVRIRIFNP